MWETKGRKMKERCVGDNAMYCFTPEDSPNADEYVTIFCDELEALKLKNNDNLDIITWWEKMGISKSTFARIYDSASKKITDALLNGKTIRIAKRCYLKE